MEKQYTEEYPDDDHAVDDNGEWIDENVEPITGAAGTIDNVHLVADIVELEVRDLSF